MSASRRSSVSLRLLLIAAALVAGPVVAVPPAGTLTVAASGKSFSLTRIETTAVINADRSMHVTEVVDYRFDGGPFQYGIRTFDRDLAKVRNFAASDAEGPLTVIPPASSESGGWEWVLRRPTSDRAVRFTVDYDVVDVVRVGSDVGDLYWQFFGDDYPAVGSMTITVRFPTDAPPADNATTSDDDASVLRAWGHGPSQGRLDLAPGVVVAEVGRVPAKTFVELRVVGPASAFTTQGSAQLLPGVLAEERSFLEEQQETRDRRRLGHILSIVLGALGIVGTVVVWLTLGRERTSREVLGEYWREPLDERPAVAAANLKRGTIDRGNAIASTLVDMAQRGYVRIEGETEKRFGPDKTVLTYTWTGKPYDDSVAAYERELMEMIFRGATVTTSDELTKWARSNQTTAKSQLDRIVNGVKRAYKAHRFEEPIGRKAKWPIGMFLVLAAGGVSTGALLKAWSGWVLAGGSVLLLVISLIALRNRTQSGAEAAAKAEGLRRYLKDFSRLDEAPIGHLVLWERYLVFAVALGVSGELIRGLQAKLPEVLADPNFSPWYVGHGSRFHGFDTIGVQGASLASASTPSSNTGGGGGGFSGGGGGGGGGGGFGAR